MSKLSELLAASAKAAWPVVAVVLAILFRKDLSGLIRRFRKGKILGQEVELSEEVAALRTSVDQARKEVSEQPPSQHAAPAIHTEQQMGEADVLSAIKANPEFGMIRLSSLIEKELQQLSTSLGLTNSQTRIPVPSLTRLLVEKGYLPKNTYNSLQIFWNLRNQIVHMPEVVNNASILGTLDSGISLLKTLKEVPREINVVVETGIVLFMDFLCKRKHRDVKGLLLEATSPDKSKKYHRIFPTTNPEYYQPGKQVSWEWNLQKVWHDAWYKSKLEGKIVKAWDTAAEFVGRHMD